MSSIIIDGISFDELTLIEAYNEILKQLKKAGSVAKEAKKRAADFCLKVLETKLVSANKNELILLKSIVR